jgi:hypothetical protein
MQTLKLWLVAMALCAAASALAGCGRTSPLDTQRTFRTPEDAAQALNLAVGKKDVAELGAIFGPDGQMLLETADPADAQRDREVFTVAMAEGWRLEDHGASKVLVIGNEEWPFPVPLVRSGDFWLFDTAAGKEEVLARRIGRNELAAIRICRSYVAAQRAYAAEGHDGRPAGLYAQRVRSEAGTQNGLYWPAAPGEKRSPLGDLMAGAADAGPSAVQPKPDSTVGTSGAASSSNGASSAKPFHGYYFRILTAQGANAPGGVKTFIRNGEMSGGFALVAWPAQYDVTGIMTFMVNQDGVVHEKDLGPGTRSAIERMAVYDPDRAWTEVP